MKTLNDLENEIPIGTRHSTFIEIRKEAIQEIKTLTDCPGDFCLDCKKELSDEWDDQTETNELDECKKKGHKTLDGCFSNSEVLTVVRYIKWKFNITEDDLK